MRPIHFSIHIIKLNIFTLLFLIAMVLTTQLYAGELREETLIPPIPASQYKAPYHENKTDQKTHTVIIDGRHRTYQAYLPPNAAPGLRPAIVVLHGANRSGASVVERWKSVANMYGIILIGPDGTNNGWDFKIDNGDYMMDILIDAHKNYPIDPTRTYLFGHSAGGIFANYISIELSNIFAATAIHAGRFASSHDTKLVKKAKRKIPIIYINGTDDKGFPITKLRETAQAFSSNGHEIELKILQGHNHWYYTLADYINLLAWDFMKQHTLPASSSVQ